MTKLCGHIPEEHRVGIRLPLETSEQRSNHSTFNSARRSPARGRNSGYIHLRDDTNHVCRLHATPMHEVEVRKRTGVGQNEIA